MNIEELVLEFEKTKKDYVDKMKVAFKETFKVFWATHPKIAAVTWVQYTPYFNDGEPCEFGVNDPFLLTKTGLEVSKEDEAFGYDMEDYEPYSYGRKKHEQYAEDLTVEEYDSARDDMRKIFRLPAEGFECTFGDHVAVTATREGFQVDEFDHV